MKKMTLAILSVLGCVSLPACSSKGDDAGDSPATSVNPGANNGGNAGAATAAGKARIRIVHASPDAPRVDVYAKGVNDPLVKGAAFGDTTGYLEVPAGSATIELRASPSTANDPVAYSTGAVTLPDGATITAVAAGLLGSKDPASAFRVLPLVEKFKGAPKGSAVVRIVHASADAPTVGIDVGNDDPKSPEIAALTRFADTGADGVELPSGTSLQIGIAAGGSTVTAFTAPALPEGGDVFVIATGLLGSLPRQSDGFSLLAVGPTGTIGFIKQNPIVVPLHASPDAPSVDAYVAKTKVIDDLTFGKLGASIQVAPGDYDLDFFAHTDGMNRPLSEPVAKKKLAKLAAGERYLAVASGFIAPQASERAFGLTAYAESFKLDNATGGELRAIHASPDAPNVDIGVVTNASLSSVLFSDLAFGDASKEASAAADQLLHLGISPTGSTVPAARFAVVPAAKSRAFAVAAGTLAPHRTANGFRLLVVDTAVTPWTVAALHPLQ